MSGTHREGDPDPTPTCSPWCDEYAPDDGHRCRRRPGHAGDHVAGNGHTIRAVWPNAADQPDPRADETPPAKHMTYREAATTVRGAVAMDPEVLNQGFMRAVLALAELGARTDGPDQPVAVGDRLWSWTAVKALPLGTFVRAVDGDHGMRAETVLDGHCTWAGTGDGWNENFPVTVVSLPGDPLPPKPTP